MDVMHAPAEISDRQVIRGICTPRSGTIVLSLPALLYAFLPRPPVGGAQFLAYPAMGGILFVFVLAFLGQKRELYPQLLVLILLLLLSNALAAISFFLNASEVRLGAVAELFRPGLFIVFLMFGYLAARSYDEADVTDGFLLAAKVILLGQTLIAVTQLAGLPVFDFIYSEEKTRSFSSLVRITGSMSNPNSLAWVVAQAAVVIVLLGQRRWLWLALASALMVVSGSRTLLLLFPFMVALVVIWRRGSSLRNYVRGAAIAIIGSATIVFLVLSLSEHLPYLGELGTVLVSGSLESISSVARRFAMWDSAYREFIGGGVQAWMFGLGSRPSTRVLDNDFLYVLFRVGAIGFVVHTAIVIYLIRLLAVRAHPGALIGLQYLLFSLALGLVFDTLGGWNYPLLLYFYAGVAIAFAGRGGLSAYPARTPSGTYARSGGV